MADKILNVEIVTPKEKVYIGQATSVSVPGSQSPFEILFNHAPIVSSLDLGSVKIDDTSEGTIKFATATGFVEVNDNKVSILVESAKDSKNIEQSVVAEQISELKKKLKSIIDKGEAEEVKKMIAEAENQLKILN